MPAPGTLNDAWRFAQARGGEVSIAVVAGHERNMKVTEPIDVYIADKLFQLTGPDSLPDSRDEAGYREALVHALNASSARVSFAEIETDRGHDAFLLDVPEFFDISRAFLESAGKARGLDVTGG